MADPNNPGQFGNREDTEQAAREGGKHSSGKFEPGSKRASDAGKKGSRNEPIEAKREGGKNSHKND